MAIEFTSTELILNPQQNRLDIGFGHIRFFARNHRYQEAREIGAAAMALVDHVEGVYEELTTLRSDLEQLGVTDLQVESFAVEMRNRISQDPKLGEQGTLNTIAQYMSEGAEELFGKAAGLQVEAASYFEQRKLDEWRKTKAEAEELTLQALQASESSKGSDRIKQTIVNLNEKGVIDPTLNDFLASLESDSVLSVPTPPTDNDLRPATRVISNKEAREILKLFEPEPQKPEVDTDEKEEDSSPQKGKREGYKIGERPALLAEIGFGFSAEYFPTKQKDLIDVVWGGKLTSADTATRTALTIAELLTTDKEFRASAFQDLKRSLLAHPVVGNMTEKEIISVLTRRGDMEGEDGVFYSEKEGVLWFDDFERAQQRGLEQQKLDQIDLLLRSLPTIKFKIALQIEGRNKEILPDDALLLIVLNEQVGENLNPTYLAKKTFNKDAVAAYMAIRKRRLAELLNESNKPQTIESSGSIGPVNSWYRLNRKQSLKVAETGEVLDLATWVLKEEVGVAADASDKKDNQPKPDQDRADNDEEKKEYTKKGEVSIKAFKLAFGLEGELIKEYDNLVFETWKHLLGSKRNPTKSLLISNSRAETSITVFKILEKLNYNPEQLKTIKIPNLAKEFILEVREKYPYILEFTPEELEKIVNRQEGWLELLNIAKEKFEKAKIGQTQSAKLPPKDAAAQAGEVITVPVIAHPVVTADERVFLEGLLKEDLLKSEADYFREILHTKGAGSKRKFIYFRNNRPDNQHPLTFYVNEHYGGPIFRTRSQSKEVTRARYIETTEKLARDVYVKIQHGKQMKEQDQPVKPNVEEALRFLENDPILSLVPLEDIRLALECKISLEELRRRGAKTPGEALGLPPYLQISESAQQAVTHPSEKFHQRD